VASADGVLASALEVIEIAELSRAAAGVFSAGELAYAASKSDPERRLAARLAAKRAVARLLGVAPGDAEIVPRPGGPPRLELSERAKARLHAIGGLRALVSLSHGRSHAAAAVLLLGP
jgi:phosphopantetheinyl transferase (holo-ACP synthase)